MHTDLSRTILRLRARDAELNLIAAQSSLESQDASFSPRHRAEMLESARQLISQELGRTVRGISLAEVLLTCFSKQNAMVYPIWWDDGKLPSVQARVVAALAEKSASSHPASLKERFKSFLERRNLKKEIEDEYEGVFREGVDELLKLGVLSSTSTSGAFFSQSVGYVNPVPCLVLSPTGTLVRDLLIAKRET
jgi:hypothetical protein